MSQNIILNNVLNRIEEIKELNQKYFNNNEYYMMIGGILALVGLFTSFLGMDISSITTLLGFLLCVVGISIVGVLDGDTKEIKFIPWIDNRKIRNISKKTINLIDYLSQISVQVELISLFQEKFSDKELDQLKSSFALAEYDKAISLILYLTKKMTDLEKENIKEQKSKIVEQYGQKVMAMQMKL